MVGIYRKTFKQKPTISLAPDAIVTVANSPYIQICPKCGGTILLSEFITNISTNLANNTTVGNAQFTLSIPKHGHEGHNIVRGGRVYGLNLMDEIKIYIKSRFPISREGKRQYHQVFWGMITNIQESYSDGYQNISISCESILKWLEMMQTNEHPSAVSFNDVISTVTDAGAALYTGKTYANLNVYEIIYKLLSVGLLNIVIPAQIDTEKGTNASNTKGENLSAIYPQDIQLMDYWQDRFKEARANLKMFGANLPFSVIGEAQTQANRTSKEIEDAAKDPFITAKINYSVGSLIDFRPFFNNDDRGEIGLVSSSYKNNLEIINEIKTFTGFEFYLDTNGDIVFKPPFWNLDTRGNPVFVLKDEDIFSWDFSEDANAVVTRVDVTGARFALLKGDTPGLNPRGIFTDYSLARQFGIKSVSIYARHVPDKDMAYYHAISELDRVNSQRFRASITIIGRPEIRLGYPVYIKSRDTFAYIENISHNFNFGGQFTTTLELSCIRRKYLGDRTIASREEVRNDSRKFKYYGYPVLLIYEEKYGNPKIDDPEKTKNITEEEKARNEKMKKDQDNKGDFRTNRNGVYKEYSLFDSKAQDILNQLDVAKKNGDNNAYLKFLDKCIPISDEAGYELIGSFENGRTRKLTRDWKLKKKGTNFGEILTKLQGSKDSDDLVINEIVNEGTPGDETLLENAATGTTLEDSIAENFSKTTAKFLSDLIPRNEISKGCNCEDNDLTITNNKAILDPNYQNNKLMKNNIK